MNIKNSREAILNHALFIFGKLGYHKTTMADIAEASNRGRRTIYTYFKTKEEVYEAVVEREISRVTIDVATAIQAIESTPDKLCMYLELRMTSIINLSKKFDALRSAFTDNYQWVEKIRKTLDCEEQKILIELLESGSNNQIFSIKNIEATVKNIMLMTKGVELMLIRENNDKTTASLIENYKQILLKGLLIR